MTLFIHIVRVSREKEERPIFIRVRFTKNLFCSFAEMQRKIFILIVTDVVCWLPICMIAFCSYAGLTISNQVYTVAAVILLPINSAVNPIIYSKYGTIFLGRLIAWVKGLSRLEYLTPGVSTIVTNTKTGSSGGKSR